MALKRSIYTVGQHSAAFRVTSQCQMAQNDVVTGALFRGNKSADDKYVSRVMTVCNAYPTKHSLIGSAPYHSVEKWDFILDGAGDLPG